MKAVPDCGENITAVDYDAKVHVINDIIVKSVKSNLYFRSRLQFKELAVKSRKFRDKEPSRVSLRKVMLPWKFENWEWKWKMFSETQFPFLLIYTTLLLIINGAKLDMLKGKLISSVSIFSKLRV